MDSKTKDNLETFVCQMYGYSEVVRVNEVRRLMFLQAKKAPDGLPPSQDALFQAKKAPDGLPPSQDALLHHFQRVNHQVTL